MMPSGCSGWTSLKLLLGLPEVDVEVVQSMYSICTRSSIFSVEEEHAIVFNDRDAGPDGAGLSYGIAPLGCEIHTFLELTE